MDVVSALDSACMADHLSKVPGKGSIEVQLTPDVQFSAGDYSVNIAFGVDGVLADHVEQALCFSVGDDMPFGWKQKPPLSGICHFEHAWVFG